MITEHHSSTSLANTLKIEPKLKSIATMHGPSFDLSSKPLHPKSEALPSIVLQKPFNHTSFFTAIN
ncbi:hypothetical protein Syun_015416 [Stephania yunnanensis]|uniref:Uncharacterized protein n=1 Tax=Stephania yunnanensis TaxID=152371 RepID=A0AAP0JL47_9MAGN